MLYVGHSACSYDGCAMVELIAMLERYVASGDWPAVTTAFEYPDPGVGASVYGTIRLYGPPWLTVEERVSRGEGPFWDLVCAAPEGLVREKSLVVGDMGIGAESPVILDFQTDELDPLVLVLVHAPDSIACKWLPLADSLESLLETVRSNNPP